MKTRIITLLALTIVAITSFSCGEKEKKSKVKSQALITSNQNETTYTPGTSWQLAWADEFEEATINQNNWNFQVVEAGHYNDEWQRYTNSNENAYIEAGNLVIKANHESDIHGMNQYTSARLNTANKQAWKYGKIAARIKLPKGQGIWPAFWMLGANINENGGDTPWPQSGEIDILELYGSKNDSIVEANIHYADATNSHAMMEPVAYKSEDGSFADDYHVFELEWTKEHMKWAVDGTQFASKDITADELSEFHEKFFILFNLAVGGTYAGRPDDSTAFPQYMYVDWVRVYQEKE